MSCPPPRFLVQTRTTRVARTTRSLAASLIFSKFRGWSGPAGSCHLGQVSSDPRPVDSTASSAIEVMIASAALI